MGTKSDNTDKRSTSERDVKNQMDQVGSSKTGKRGIRETTLADTDMEQADQASHEDMRSNNSNKRKGSSNRDL